MEELSLVLWRERELLDMLAFKLEEEELVLAHGRSRWLAFASREVETVLDMIARTEVLRAATADAVAAASGLECNPSLHALVDSSDEPWRTILLDHRDALLTLVPQITALAAASRELLTAGCGTSPALDDLLQLQEVVYRAALATTTRVLQPTLLEFLR